MFKQLLVFVLVVTVSSTNIYAETYAETPNLGQPFTDAPIPPTILTDGTGLPEGSGDARVGEKLFQTHCLACHGVEGQHGLNDQLVGGQGSLSGAKPIKTVGSYWPFATTLFDYINRAMPYQAPGKLSASETYAITAYILHKNEIISVDKEMNATSLVQVIMPNRDNFIWEYKEP